jgi:GNAT superfamily N-acetyltransferase
VIAGRTIIRRAGPEDAGLVAGLITRFFAEEGFGGDPDRHRSSAPLFLAEPANAVFLAMRGDEAVGLATVTTTFGFESGRYAEMEDLYVIPGFRNRGLAARLLDAVVEWCRTRECAALEVVVTPDGESRYGLTGWYLERGFSDEGRRLLARRL